MIDSKANEQVCQLLEDIDKDLKGKEMGGLFTLGDRQNWSDVRLWIPTGCTVLDWLMTSYDAQDEPMGGGYACGRWYEIFGPEASGKTTSYIQAMIANQRQGGLNVLLDSETRLYKPRATRMGLDLSKLVMLNAEYLEKGIECIDLLCSKLAQRKALANMPVLIAWDTIAVSPTKAEFEGGKYAGGQAGGARGIHEMIRDLVTKLPSHNICLLLINQIRDTMRSYGKSTDTPGGRGLKFQASGRVEFKKVGVYNDPVKTDMISGIISRATIVKSSLFLPYGSCDIALNAKNGYDDLLTTIWFHLQSGLVKNASGRYRCEEYQGDKVTGKYLRDFLDLIREDELFQDFLKNKIREHVHLFWKKAASYSAKNEGEG